MWLLQASLITAGNWRGGAVLLSVWYRHSMRHWKKSKTSDFLNTLVPGDALLKACIHVLTSFHGVWWWGFTETAHMIRWVGDQADRKSIVALELALETVTWLLLWNLGCVPVCLTVSQTNESDCVFICVMAGKSGEHQSAVTWRLWLSIELHSPAHKPKLPSPWCNSFFFSRKDFFWLLGDGGEIPCYQLHIYQWSFQCSG